MNLAIKEAYPFVAYDQPEHMKPTDDVLDGWATSFFLHLEMAILYQKVLEVGQQNPMLVLGPSQIPRVANLPIFGHIIAAL